MPFSYNQTPAPSRKPHPLFAPIFSMAAAMLVGLGIGVLHVPGKLESYAALFVLIGILFYIWSAHFWAQQRYAMLEEELVRIRRKLEAER